MFDPIIRGGDIVVSFPSAETKPSEQQLLTDISVSEIEDSLTEAICSATGNDDYDVRIQEFERVDDLGSLRIVMRAEVPKA
ncbi:MAG: hypothetical protein ACP5JG_10205 [Anaerolineae bacterium]